MSEGLTMSLSWAEIASIVHIGIDDLEHNLMEEIFVELENKTPVDTGTARAGWELHGLQITNDVPYIGHLEMGTVHHAPVGMLATTLVEVDDIIARII